MMLVADHQPAKALQPGKEALNLPSPQVATQDSASLSFSFSSWPLYAGRSFLWPILPQTLVQTVTVVCIVADQPGWDFVDKTRFKRLFDQGHLMRRSAGHVDGDRKTASVRNCHDLGVLASLGFANPSAPLFAEANVPSMKPSLRSMPPRSRRSSARPQRMRSPPSRYQRCSQRWHVWYGGYRFGISSQGALVLRIQMMPPITSRGSRAGLPLPSSRTLGG
ncbi:MAG: hypothetical protein FD177_2221 [Desulfovibrionaceae bacterium]|nr:MAG: hypothetical protein FD177_2221 [Desulfovibrionaceae bacterium]